MTDSNGKNSKFLKRQPRLGDVVQVKTTLQEGTVKFIGGIHFKSGTWVGIELFEHGSGKNNGTIKGVTYFKCPEKTGLLVMVSSVNVLKPAQKIVTNSQKALLVSKTLYKQTKKQQKKSVSPKEPATPIDDINITRKIRTLPRTTKAPTIKVKPRPKSTQVVKPSHLNKSNSARKSNRVKENITRPPAQTNININMTMTTSPKEKSIFLKNRPNSSSIFLPNCEVDAEISDDSNGKNINDAIINGLQNTLVHLKDIVSGLADEYVKDDQKSIPLIETTIQEEDEEIDESFRDGSSIIDSAINSQDNDSVKENLNNNLDDKSLSLNFSSSSLSLNNSDGKNRMVKQSLKQVTDSQRTISELSIGLVNAQQEVRKLKDIQTNLNRELGYYKEENKSLIERVTDLEKQNKSLSVLSSKERYYKELEAKNKKLNIEYEQVKNELFFSKKNIEELYRRLEYNDSPKSLSVYNKYSGRRESRIAHPKAFTNTKRNTNYNNMYSKSKSIKDNGSSEFSFNSDSETKINDTLLDMKEQNEKLILENETLHEEMEMLKNTLLDVQDDRENSSNYFMETMEYQEKKYEDLKSKYDQIESEKLELLKRIENITGKKGEIDLSSINDKVSNTSPEEDTMISEMKNIIADMETSLNKTVESEKEARSNFDAVNKLYEASKVKMETLKQELEQRKMDYQLLSESNEELTKENNELKQVLEEMNRKQAESSTNEELQKQYDQLKKQFEATKAIIEDKEAEMINYDVQCSQLEGQIIDFEKQLSMKQNEIDCLLEKYQTLEKAQGSHDLTEDEKDSVIQDQANKICTLEEFIKECKDENNLLKIHNEENINEISKLNKMKSDLEIQMANKENELEKKKLELETNKSSDMKQEIQDKNNKIEELTRQNTELSGKIKESNEKFVEIQNDKEKVDKELEELNKHMSQNTQELESITLKYEEDKKRYEKEIEEINKDRENSVQHAKKEIEVVISQLTDARKQFEIKVNQLENSKQMMQKEYETEIEDLNHQLQLLANLQQQTEQAENLLELSTLLDESERAKEIAESNAENRRKLLEKVIVERDQLSQDLQSEKEKFLTLKDDYEQCKKRINELEKEDLSSFYMNKDTSLSKNNSKDNNDYEKLKQENAKLKEEVEELGILKTINVQEIDNALKQSYEDIQKEREEKEMLEKGYALIWNSYISLEKECQKLLDQINEKAKQKQSNLAISSLHKSLILEKANSESSHLNSNFQEILSPKNKMNTTFDSIQDYTYDFDYDSVPDSTNIITSELKDDPMPSNTNENKKDSGKRASIETSNTSESHPSNIYYSPRPDGKDKMPMSALSESSSNTLYSPKRHSSFNTTGKYQSLPRTSHNRIKEISNYKSQSVIFEGLENDDTLYHKPEDEGDLINYSSILQKSRSRSSTLYNNNNKYTYN